MTSIKQAKWIDTPEKVQIHIESEKPNRKNINDVYASENECDYAGLLLLVLIVN